jgi:hypothetical protein
MTYTVTVYNTLSYIKAIYLNLLLQIFHRITGTLLGA